MYCMWAMCFGCVLDMLWHMWKMVSLQMCKDYPFQSYANQAIQMPHLRQQERKTFTLRSWVSLNFFLYAFGSEHLVDTGFLFVAEVGLCIYKNHTFLSVYVKVFRCCPDNWILAWIHIALFVTTYNLSSSFLLALLEREVHQKEVYISFGIGRFWTWYPPLLLNVGELTRTTIG